MRSRALIAVGVVALLGVIGGVVLMTHQHTERACTIIGTNTSCASLDSYPYVAAGVVIAVASIIIALGAGVATVRRRQRAGR